LWWEFKRWGIFDEVKRFGTLHPFEDQ